jgi:predicted metal-dependent hydrolase
MKRRLGSCTEGGSTDGDIRISDRIKEWPRYVLDYVIAHELAHRKYPNHSSAFWDYLARYPHIERARGFIDGIAYAQGDDPDSLI